MKKYQISDHFTARTMLLFALPSIGMQLVDNTYQVADGYFISNFINSSAFAAESLVFPPMAVIMGLGLMFGSGASALISQTLGEGDPEKADRQLSMSIGILAALGILVSAAMYLLMPWVSRLVGATDELLPYCVEYGHILALCMPFQILNSAFHPLLIAADRPGLGFIVSVINAAANILLDWVAVALLGWGMKGAALATGLAWIVSAVIPLVFFARNRIARKKAKAPGQGLCFGRFRWNGKELLQICYNGASEMADAISYALIAMLFNSKLLALAGEFGVDAYAVSEYVTGIFTAVFFGISMSITPAVGYHLGQKNKAELRSLRNQGLSLMGILGLVMAALSFAFAWQIAGIFVGYDEELMKLSVQALRIISFSYLLGGITTFSSAFFTGMGDGTASLSVALVKSFILPLAGLLLLPSLMGLTGIWVVTPLAEVVALLVVLFFFLRYRKKQIL